MNKNIDINRSNYETFVIDYLDGSLNTVETACFVVFLENNPDIKEEILDLNNITLKPNKKIFTEKIKLKKKTVTSVNNINEINYEEFFIAYYEGDLSEPQKNSLQQFLKKNPGLNPEFRLHDSLQLAPNKNIVFSDKNLLKHKSILRPFWYSSAAAILILFAASWYLFNQQSPSLREEIASVNQITSKEAVTSLSLITIAKIEIEERQISKIKLSGSEFSHVDREDIILAHVESKSISRQLVNAYDFPRLVEKQNNKITTTPEEYATGIAAAEPINKKQNKRLIAKVFNNQVAKIKQRIGSNKSKSNKYTDPVYIQALDKGVLVFNTLTGNEASTMKTYNWNGELTSYQIEGQEVLLSRNFSGKSSR